MNCQHGSLLFLPWHRTYLYTFEQYLLDTESTVRLPWWDWADDQAIPSVYDQAALADGSPNPLAAAPVTGIPAQEFTEENVPEVTETFRQPDPSSLPPGPADVDSVMALNDFTDFSMQLEQQLHNRVHNWVGGTMAMIPLAAFDPIFWAHHTMVDRLWSIWQQTYPGAGVGPVPLDYPLSPFPNMTVSNVLDISALGYEYAAFTSSAVP